MFGILAVLIIADATLTNLRKKEAAIQNTGALWNSQVKKPTPQNLRGPDPTIPVIGYPRPDLIIEYFQYNPNPAMQSAAPASVGFTFNVKNIGTGTAVLPTGTKFTITCLSTCHPTQNSNVVIGQITVNSTTNIQQGMRVTYTGNTIATPTNNMRHMFGTYQTQIKADSTNLVAEIYETNNLYNRPLIIKASP